ncbi:MAG: four helix bundle protein [Patescibacteria group bacterium]|nr:four helix bundle protein [bacterium]MDZ4205842.1 four helix bundle protein [Patescibacteria group bacterium]
METLSIISRVYEVYKLVAEMNVHLEKKWRYALGQSLEVSILDCLSELIMAKNAPKPLKASYLIKAGSHQEVAILKLRLMLERKLGNVTKIFQAQSLLAEIGRMLGGWLRSLSST